MSWIVEVDFFKHLTIFQVYDTGTLLKHEMLNMHSLWLKAGFLKHSVQSLNHVMFDRGSACLQIFFAVYTYKHQKF